MPGCAIHFELARRVLEAWKNQPASRPFSPDDPACRRAFLFGSLAPDLGYFPGGDGLLADLAHCVRPADLARSLIHLAATDVERALAWGWATHVLGDIEIHRLINQAAALRVRGRRVPGLTFADDPIIHIRIESGLDATLPAIQGWPEPNLRGGFDPGASAIALFARAYHGVYGLRYPRMRMIFAHRASARLVPGLLLFGRVFSERPVRALPRWLCRRAATLTKIASPRSRCDGFTNPLALPEWLLDEAAAVVESFVERFQSNYASNMADLPNANLDTGKIEDDPPDYPITISALAELRRKVSARDRAMTRLRKRPGNHPSISGE
jgi:hypothetical protein